MMPILETERLQLCQLTSDDAAFILELVNDPSWIQYIGDKNIHTPGAAKEYIRNGPQQSYERFGFGLYAVRLRENDEAIGMCGLLRRDTLDDPDIGFAFLPRFTGSGYAYESAMAVLDAAQTTWKMTRVLAITSIGNERSVKLLSKLGFRFSKQIRLTPEAEELNLFERIF